MADVQVSRPVLLATGVALVGLLVAVAFLAGRESTRSKGPQPTAAVIRPRAAPPPVETPPPPDAVTPPTEPAARPAPEVTPEPRPSPRAPVAPAAPAAPSAWPGAQEVSDYFKTVDALQIGAGGGSANTFAASIVEGLGQGNTEPLNAIVRDAREAERKAAAITPPAACRGYHSQLQSTLRESREMMEQLQRAFASNDMDALSTISSSAGALQAKVEALQLQATAIKQQHRLQ